MSMGRRWLLGALILAGAALASCRTVAGPTPQPTQTPTPMSTPLATLAPTLVAGSEDNPVQLVIVHESSGRAARNAASALQEALAESTDLTLEVNLVDSDRAAVEALCRSFNGPPAVAFVSGPGYSAASALGCGSPVLLAEDPESEAVTRDVIVIAGPDSDISVLADLRDATFCRLGATDLASWQAPSLLLLANGLTPTTLLRDEVDQPDLDALLEQVMAGDCDAGALYADDFEGVATDEQLEGITRLEPAVSLPMGVVMASTETALGVRTALTEALRDLARTDDGADLLDTLFGAAGLVVPDSDSLAAWDEFIASTGIDFAAF